MNIHEAWVWVKIAYDSDCGTT